MLDVPFCPINGPQIALDETLYGLDSDDLPVEGELCLPGVAQVSSSPKAPEFKYSSLTSHESLYFCSLSLPT